MKKPQSIFLSMVIAGFTIAWMPVAAAPTDMGCCTETNANDPSAKPKYSYITEAQCQDIATRTNNAFTGAFKANMLADSSGCKPKPPTPTRRVGDPVYFTPAVSIPGSEFTAGQKVQVQDNTSTLANYFVAIAKYSTGIIGILAAIALMAGGIIWLTAGGNHEQIGNARTIIGSSLAGLGLSLVSFLLLAMVNTNLVVFKPIGIPTINRAEIKDFGCCIKTDKKTNAVTSEQILRDDCTKIDYAKTEFKPFSEGGWTAQDNTCVATAGCCHSSRAIVFGTRDKNTDWCVDEVTVNACDKTSSSNWWGLPEVNTSHYLARTCGQVAECAIARRCRGFEECRAQTLAEEQAEDQ